MFLTKDEVRAARLRGQVKFPIAGVNRSISVVAMVASRALEMRDLQKKLSAGEISQIDLFRMMVQNACVDEKGDLFSAEDVDQILGTLTLNELVSLIGLINTSLELKTDPGATGNSEGSPAVASPSASV